MPNENDYRRPMRRFMSFLDGVEYENADIPGKFTTEKLASIKPEDILKWMNKLVYGNENPSDNHDMSPLIRSSTVEQWKKGISHWMPMQEMDRQRKLEYHRLNRNIQRVALQPARRRHPDNPPINPNPFGAAIQGNNNNNPLPNQQLNQQDMMLTHQQATMDPTAKLAPTPRNLYLLWQEWQFGLSGNKPARSFTREERGRDKHRFTRRKVIWDTVIHLINQGLSYNVAIDRIYAVYGSNQSVTTIINRLRKDKKDGRLHSSLA